MVEKQAYTIHELTELGPLGRSSLYEAIRGGTLTARKFGRSTIVLKDDWERFLLQLPKFAPPARKAA